MQFVDRTTNIGGGYIEWYANPVTRELIARYDATETRPRVWDVRNNQHIIILEDYTDLDTERLNIMSRQQEDDSRRGQHDVTLTFCDLGLHDIVPIVNSYLHACYPPRLKPVAIDVLISWLPDYDFTGLACEVTEVHKIGHKDRSCNHTNYGSCSLNEQLLQVVRCDNIITLFIDDDCECAVSYLVNICVERVIAERQIA